MLLKIIYKFKSSKVFQNIVILCSFVLLALFAAWLIIDCKNFSGDIDYDFHLGRILELKRDFMHGNFLPEIAFHSFNYGGNAVPIFYPYLNLLPLVILTFITGSVRKIMVFNYMMNVWIASCSSYYGCRVNHKSIATSYSFAIIYGLSFSIMQYSLKIFDLGAAAAISLLPLVLLGFVHWYKTGRWLMLSLGMSLIGLCHVITTILVLIMVLTLLIINSYKIDKNKWCSLFKATSLTLFITFVFWGRLLKLTILNHIAPVKVQNPLFWSELRGISFKSMIQLLSPQFSLTSSTGGVCPEGLTVFAILGLVLGLFVFLKFDRIDKQLYIISIIFIFLISPLFPWHLFDHNNFLNFIQFPWRLFIIPQVILCYLFVIEVTKCLNINNHNIKIFSLGLIILCSLGLSFYNQKVFVQKWINSSANNVPLTLNSAQSNTSQNPIKSNRSDYYTKETVRNKFGLGLVNNNSNLLPRLGLRKQEGNFSSFDVFGSKIKIRTHASNVHNVVLPVAYYNGIHYRITNHGHQLPYQDAYGLLQINPKNKLGKKYTIHIQTVNHFDWIYHLTFVIGIILYIFLGSTPKKYHQKLWDLIIGNKEFIRD